MRADKIPHSQLVAHEGRSRDLESIVLSLQLVAVELLFIKLVVYFPTTTAIRKVLHERKY